MISIVVAHSRNRCIGRDGDLPWRLPQDLRRFRELTTGGTVIMGRRTYESLPAAFRPLPDRRNVVLSRDPSFSAEGADVFADLDSALASCSGPCFVVGGGEVYAQALARADRVEATFVDAEVDGDAFFPALDEERWRCVAESEPLEENGLPFRFRTFARVA